jgi:hypothetical protein
MSFGRGKLLNLEAFSHFFLMDSWKHFSNAFSKGLFRGIIDTLIENACSEILIIQSSIQQWKKIERVSLI